MLNHTIRRDLVRQRRKDLGLSVTELAALVRISEDYLYKIEEGARQPSKALAERIATALRLTFEEITLLGPPTPTRVASLGRSNTPTG